jgi:hypothetical protein
MSKPPAATMLNTTHFLRHVTETHDLLRTLLAQDQLGKETHQKADSVTMEHQCNNTHANHIQSMQHGAQ